MDKVTSIAVPTATSCSEIPAYCCHIVPTWQVITNNYHITEQKNPDSQVTEYQSNNEYQSSTQVEREF